MYSIYVSHLCLASVHHLYGDTSMHHIDVTHECDRCTTSWYRIYVSHLWTAFMYQVTVSHLCETSVDQAHVSHLCIAYTYHMDLYI